MVGKLLVIVAVVAVVGWSLHRSQIKRSQERLRELGQALADRGIDFQAWLRAAGLEEAALRDRSRRDEVQARLESAARRLLAS